MRLFRHYLPSRLGGYGLCGTVILSLFTLTYMYQHITPTVVQCSCPCAEATTTTSTQSPVAETTAIPSTTTTTTVAPSTTTVSKPIAPHIKRLVTRRLPSIPTRRLPPTPKHRVPPTPKPTEPPLKVGNETIHNTIPCGDPGKTCSYPEEVDLRVIVITFNRQESLSKCLGSLQTVELGDGITAALEIWIDRNVKDQYFEGVYKVAKNFTWKHGSTRVNVWNKHVGIYGQWIDTWRPRENSTELALYLEDDVDVSPHFYKWLKRMHEVFGKRRDLSGYSLQDENIKLSSGADLAAGRHTQQSMFFGKAFGTWGFAPHPDNWRKFQTWFHGHHGKPGFKPYVREYAIFTSWYKTFEKIGRASSMWSQWYVYFTNQEQLWSIHSNAKWLGKDGRSLVKNRMERGLHYSQPSGQQNKSTDRYLIQTWSDKYVLIPSRPAFFDYAGRAVPDPSVTIPIPTTTTTTTTTTQSHSVNTTPAQGV